MDRRAAAERDAEKVRRAYPLSFVQVKPCQTAAGCVLLRRGFGEWELRTVSEAIDLTREWKQELYAKRKEAK